MEPRDTFGQRLEYARRRRLITQIDLAKAAGLSQVTVNGLANDRTAGQFRPHTVRMLAAALAIDPVWLLTGEGEMEPGNDLKDAA